MHSPPPSSTIIGLIAVAGVWAATFRVPPLVGVPPAALDEPDEDDAGAFALPQAARSAAITEADVPATVARRMNSRRSSRPASNSST